MPIFKSTKNIFTDHQEHFNSNWMDSDTIVLPETRLWDNSRELKIEDVELWEVIADFSGGGVYASWTPYAPFYLCVLPKAHGGVKTWYGKEAEKDVKQYMKEKHIPIPKHLPHPQYQAIEITEQGITYNPIKKPLK